MTVAETLQPASYIQVVISIKDGCNTIVWTKIRYLRHFVQSLLAPKFHTSRKISKFC